MRYFPLLFLLPFSLSLPLLPASADDSPALLSQSLSSENFWSQAQRLVQEQLDLIYRAEQAIASPDLKRVEAVRGQLILHSGAVERFLKSQYRIPRLLCSNSTTAPDPYVATDLSSPQRQVYCTLYASTQQLRPVVSQLERRLPMLAGLAAPNTLPRVPPVQDYSVPEPLAIGLPAKTPIAEENLPFQPAIAPPQQAIFILEEARKQLLSTVPAFPTSVQIITC